MPGSPDPTNVRVPCSNCGGKPRIHEVLREFSHSWRDDWDEQGTSSYQICRCKGCERIIFRESSWSTYDNPSPPHGEIEPTVTVYPQVAQSERPPIDKLDLPDPVSRIYGETIVAFNAGALTLAGGGLRAIVEAICIDQKVRGSNLQDKIDDLAVQGLLAKPQAELLHEERYIGNAALHEILAPAKQEIEDGLAIVEGLINTIYVLPLRAARLRSQREKRAKT